MAFAENLKQGRGFEEWAAERLVEDGWSVLPLADLPARGGRGPRLRAGGRDPTLPDLQATKHGRHVAVECKRKEAADWGRVVGEWEHGTSRHLLDSYREYERQTGVATFLVIGEVSTQSVYAQRVTELRVHFSYSPAMGHMAYWPRSQMRGGPWREGAWLLRLNRYVEQSGYRR